MNHLYSHRLLNLSVLGAACAAAAALITGCSSAPTAHASNPKVIMAAITATPVGGDGQTTYPAQQWAGAGPGPVAVPAANRGVPVYVGPKITETILAPYENEKGQLFGPQVMYEKVSEGHMNPEALQNPDLAYIPQENMVVPPGMGNPVSAPAMQRAAQEDPRLLTDTIDPRDIVVTGLLGKESNKAEAERMGMAAGRRAVFDPDLGWILVPLNSAK